MNNDTQLPDSSDKPVAPNHTFDPVKAITGLLSQNGHPNPEAWYEYLTGDALLDTTPNAVKRFLANRAWRTILGTLPQGAPRERFCLIDEGDEQVWLKLFTEDVLPAVLLYQLPVPFGDTPVEIKPDNQS